MPASKPDEKAHDDTTRPPAWPFVLVGVILVAGGVGLAFFAPSHTDVVCERDGTALTCRVEETTRAGLRDQGALTSEHFVAETVKEPSGAELAVLGADGRAVRLPLPGERGKAFVDAFVAFRDGAEPSFRYGYDEEGGADTTAGLISMMGIVVLGVGALMFTTPGFLRRGKRREDQNA